MQIYRITIIVDQSVLDLNSTDSLCISQEVNENFQAVCYHVENPPLPDGYQLQHINSSTITCMYKVHFEEPFGGTESVEISFGEMVEYQSGLLPAQPAPEGLLPRPASQFAVVGSPFQYHLALDANRPENQEKNSLLVWFDPDIHMPGVAIALEPKAIFKVFWRSRSSDMKFISPIELKDGYKIDFTDDEYTQTVRVGYKNPGSPETTEVPTWYAQTGAAAK